MYTENTTPRCHAVEPRVTEGCGCERATVGDGATEKSCSVDATWGLRGYPLAMVYAPLQSFRSVLDPKEALSTGTVFGELDLPFHPGGRKGGGTCG